MAKSPTHKYLKVYTGQASETRPPVVEGIRSLPAVLTAFQRATGWSLRYAQGPAPTYGADLPWSTPVNPGEGITPGHLKLEAGRSEPVGLSAGSSAEAARQLASAVAGMLSETRQTQHALWQREAELAAGVPLIPADDESNHLAARLEAVLKSGAQAVGAQAAALYLLDDATSQLKLRSSWGLPRDRLLEPPRPLRGSVADLEALLGSAVVLEDVLMMQHWKVPEEGFAAAACVPISSPTTLLGTLWVYCTTRRDFNDHQTGLLEIVAGRLAADLEREMLLREGIEAAKFKRQVAAAEQLQQDLSPTVAPQVDGWDLSGWAVQAGTLGGDFFDWFCLPDGRLVAVAGSAHGKGIEAALVACSVRSAIRCHAQYHDCAARVLTEVNRTLWTGCSGGQQAAVFMGILDPLCGELSYSTAGTMGILRIGKDGWKSLTERLAPVGGDPDAAYSLRAFRMESDEALLLVTEGVISATDSQGRVMGEAGVADLVAGERDRSAKALVAAVRGQFHVHRPSRQRNDQALLAVCRTAP